MSKSTFLHTGHVWHPGDVTPLNWFTNLTKGLFHPQSSRSHRDDSIWSRHLPPACRKPTHTALRAVRLEFVSVPNPFENDKAWLFSRYDGSPEESLIATKYCLSWFQNLRWLIRERSTWNRVLCRRLCLHVSCTHNASRHRKQTLWWHLHPVHLSYLPKNHRWRCKADRDPTCIPHCRYHSKGLAFGGCRETRRVWAEHDTWWKPPRKYWTWSLWPRSLWQC